jgi:cold shock CspA family protein
MIGKITIEGKRISVVDQVNGEAFPLGQRHDDQHLEHGQEVEYELDNELGQRHDDQHLEHGQEVEYELDNEYPASCKDFCDGDETCVICYHKNIVAIIK